MKDAPAIEFDKENILAMEKLKYFVLKNIFLSLGKFKP